MFYILGFLQVSDSFLAPLQLVTFIEFIWSHGQKECHVTTLPASQLQHSKEEANVQLQSSVFNPIFFSFF